MAQFMSSFFSLSVFIHLHSSHNPKNIPESAVCLCLCPVMDHPPSVCSVFPCRLHGDTHPPCYPITLLILPSVAACIDVSLPEEEAVNPRSAYMFLAAEEGLTTDRLTLEATSEKKSQEWSWMQ